MNSKPIFLDTSETFGRIVDSFPHGHPIRTLADSLRRAEGARSTGMAGAGAEGELLEPRGTRGTWKGEVGLLGAAAFAADEEAPFLIWLGPGAPSAGIAPGQLLLSLPRGRYGAEYWAPGEPAPLGVEIGTSPSLVLSPPSTGPLVAVVHKIDKNGRAI